MGWKLICFDEYNYSLPAHKSWESFNCTVQEMTKNLQLIILKFYCSIFDVTLDYIDRINH